MRNATLWKRVLNEGIPLPSSISETEKEIERRILSSTIIVDRRAPGREVTNDFSMISAVCFPFPSLWMEGDYHDDQQWGVLCESHRTAELGWRARNTVIGSVPGNRLFCAGFADLFVDSSGRPNPALSGLGVPPEHLRTWSHSLATGAISSPVWIAMSMLEILACKNVSLSPHDGDDQCVRRAIKRIGGTSENYRYHTLVIRPPGAKHDSPSVEIGTMPRHVCRGHFAEYGPDFGKGLLFGRYAGRFFIPPHMKGKRENGIVEKDYEIPAA